MLLLLLVFVSCVSASHVVIMNHCNNTGCVDDACFWFGSVIQNVSNCDPSADVICSLSPNEGQRAQSEHCVESLEDLEFPHALLYAFEPENILCEGAPVQQWIMGLGKCHQNQTIICDTNTVTMTTTDDPKCSDDDGNNVIDKKEYPVGECIPPDSSHYPASVFFYCPSTAKRKVRKIVDVTPDHIKASRRKQK